MELPEANRADKNMLTESGRLLSLNMDGMNPLQLSAKRCMRFMFQVRDVVHRGT